MCEYWVERSAALATALAPQLGQVSPGRFIPIAEALGLMPEIGEWVLDAACRQLRVWLDRGHRDFTVAVNVSAQQLQRHGLVTQVGAALQRYNVPPAMLDIEITESSFMENVWRVQRTLAELKALGIKLSLDDFGTGYSSLAYLKQFPIDKLKIDQAFVRGLPTDTADAAIVRTIIAMAHELYMRVAAEGVESQAQGRRTFSPAQAATSCRATILARPCVCSRPQSASAPSESGSHQPGTRPSWSLRHAMWSVFGLRGSASRCRVTPISSPGRHHSAKG